MFGRDRRQAGRAAADSVAPGNERIARLIDEAIDRMGRGAGLELSPWELPITVACRQIVADTIGQLPLVAWRNGARRPDQPAIVLQPDPAEPPWLTKHRLVNQWTGWGYAWLKPLAYRDGAPTAVRVIDANHATGTFDPAGRLEEIWWQGERYEPGLDGIVWCPWEVTEAGQLGRSPMAGCWKAAEYLAALYQMAGSFWEAGFPSVAVMLDQALTPKQRLELREQLYGAWSRRHEPAIVDRGGRLEPVGSNAVDAELVDSIELLNTEVARAFGVMPSIAQVRAGDSLTYATTAEEFTKWLKIGLGRYIMRVEAAWNTVTVMGTTVRCDTAELLRSDLEARAAWYTAGIAGGWLTVDEVRAAEGLLPLPTGRPVALPRPPVALLTPSAA